MQPRRDLPHIVTGKVCKFCLLDEKMFNAVLVLLVVTSTLGVLLTERFAPGMIKEEAGATLAAAKQLSRPT